MSKKFTLSDFGYEVEIGKVAAQADGAVWFRHGDTVLLATVVSSPSKDFPGFLPLTTDYREPFSSAGKIPGGYFKREGRSSEHEILTSRLIDRAIRPLFPATYFNQLQVLVSVYSVDKKHPPTTLGLLASSLALTISKVPFLGPVGVVEIARIDGQWIVSPTYEQTKESDVRLVVAGTQEGVCMVEGSANELSEKEFIDALFLAHENIVKQVAWQKEIQKELGVQKEETSDDYNWDTWKERASTFLTQDKLESLLLLDKLDRKKILKDFKKEFFVDVAPFIEQENVPENLVDYVFEGILKEKLTDVIFAKGKRVDGRAFDKVRSITTEVGLLPTTHGSALFTRGRTQAMVSVTLGGGQDEQKIEGLMEDVVNRSFMLHYNFPPFSVGEARFLRGPGRREIGHGNLAASAIERMLPSKEDFPYTIRVVADILESDGSSSMATTCGSTMALLQTGVPLKKMVSGVAMGLLKSSDGEFAILTDISGFEDAFGLMDFKVTGTDTGITAIQMDIKAKTGLPRELFEKALQQAKEGRLHILGEMRKVMTEPNKELSKLVPKVTLLKIATDKIGAVIGSGGKVIREIIEVTGTTIDIDGDDGIVKIYSTPEADLEKAIGWVKTLAGQIDIGAIFKGKIRRLVDFGMFVELVPGQDGLVHVSNIPRHQQRTFMKDYNVNDVVTVKVVDYDKETGRIRLKMMTDSENK
ncbi:polyribonucleotide nucleotidyltransferase [bacterium]|nr:polyribonucleotide nucleotidyltransferase [bacterium]